jgi:Ca2+-binding RTX toxin-like protein
VLPGLTETALAMAPTTGAAILPRPTGVIQGSVWWHDGRDQDADRSSLEPGLSGQTVELHRRESSAMAPGAGIDRLVATAVTDAGGAYRFEGLPAGDYVVTHRPTATWTPAVETASAATGVWFAVQASFEKQMPVSRLFTVDPDAGAKLLLEIPEATLRDVAAIGGDVYLSGTSQGLARLWHYDTADGSLELLTSALEGRKRPGLIGLEAAETGRLIGLAEDATLHRYDVPAGTWSTLGRLTDKQGNPLYPVGDLAMLSAGEAVAVVSARPYAQGDTQPGQMLVRFDPASGALLTEPMPIEGAKQALVGLEWTGSRLFALATGGQLHPLDPDRPVIAEGFPVGLGKSPVGGLAIGTMRAPRSTEGDGVPVALQPGGKVEVGFGDVPAMRVLPDGNDLIDGGCGPESDLLNGDDGEGLPSDVLTIGGSDAIRGRDGDDTIAGGQQGDLLRGEAGDDRITGGVDGANRIDGGDGHDTITGGAVADRVFSGAGDDRVDGGPGRDWLFGEGGADLLAGGPDDDMLVGGEGADTVRGDAGDDSVIVVNALLGDDFAEDPFGPFGGTGPGLYDGGEGDDLLSIRFDDATAPVELTLADDHYTMRTDLLLGRGSGGGPVFETETIAGFERAQLAGGDGDDTLDAGTFSGATLQRGGAGDDRLTGAAGSDDADGGDGDDWIDARSGDDTVAGGTGENTLAGGDGSDLFPMPASGARDAIAETATPGFDTIDAHDAAGSLTVVIGATGATMTGALDATFDPARVKTLVLGPAADRVRVDFGGPTVLSISALDDRDVLDYGGWTAPVAIDLTAGLATRLVTVTGFEDLIGGAGDDALRGNAGDNHLAGGGGNDAIDGAGGFDEADYGSAPSGVLVDLGLAGPQNTGGAGIDTLTAIEALTGGGFDDRLVGTGGANRLRAGDGDDTLDGAAGDDTLDGGEGFDVADYASASGPVFIALDAGTPQPTGGSNADWLIDIEALIGSAFSDRLRGDDAANRLIGGTGNDTLIGRGGDDTLEGGSGLDVAVFDGPQADHEITPVPGGYRVTDLVGSGGSDLILGAERLAFSDRTLKLGPDNTAPVLVAPTIEYQDTAVADAFDPASGVLVTADADGDPLEFRLPGGVTLPGGAVSRTGPLGTLTLNPATGAWRFDPDPTALEAFAADASAIFAIEASDQVNTETGPLTVQLRAVNDAPRTMPILPTLYTDTTGKDVFLETSFILAATDPEGDALQFGITGATTTGSVRLFDGLLGTLGIDTATGAAMFVPDAAVLSALTEEKTETFELTVSDGLLTVLAPWTVTARPTPTPPGATITGTSGNDPALTGGAGNDTITGFAGADTLTGAGGDDRLDGGSGLPSERDLAIFSGPIAGYTLARAGATLTITDATPGRDGTDTATNLEKLQFSDMGVNLTVQATAASIDPATLDRLCELYLGFFARVPAADGLENWVNQFKGGKSLNTIADDFYGIGSSEALRSVTGYWDFANDRPLSDTDFVRIAYRNVLGREGLEGGINYWAGQLTGPEAKTRGELVGTMLDAAHGLETNPDWGWVPTLLDDKVTMSKRVAVDWGLNYGANASESIAKGVAIAGSVDQSPNPNPAFAAIPVKTFDFEAATELVGIDPAAIDLIA